MTVPSPNSHPGVYVTESLAGPNRPPVSVSPSVAAFAGEHWRGPVGPTLISSWAQFQQIFGGFNPNTTPALANPYLAYSVQTYFANGGSQCYVYRILSSTTPGASASRTLLDSQATGTATLTLTVGRLGAVGNVGTWGNSLYVMASPNNSVPGTGRFNLTLYYGGTTSGYIVETWIDLSMNPNDQRYVVAILNSPTSGSQWVVATNNNDSAASPYNSPAATVATAALQFSGGTDSADPSSSDWQSAFTYGGSTQGAFDQVPGVLNINLPGQTTPSILQYAITYVEQRPYSFLVIDPPSAQTAAGAVSFFASLTGLTPATSYAAVYYPWINANNPASPNQNSTILLPPGGFVLGQMVNTDSTVGVWQAPAGTNTQLVNAVSTERNFSPADLNALTASNVNPLIALPNSGAITIMGVRTMQTGYASLYVPIRRTLNYIEASLVNLMSFALFQPNDVLLWTQIVATCNSFLNGLYAQNAFPGNTSAQAFYVTCDNTNNNQNSIAQGIVNVTVGVALLFPAEFINILVSQFQSNGTTSVTVQPS